MMSMNICYISFSFLWPSTHILSSLLTTKSEELAAAIAMSMDETKEQKDVKIPKFGSAGPGLPGTFKGNYDIFAVVTHKVSSYLPHLQTLT